MAPSRGSHPRSSEDRSVAPKPRVVRCLEPGDNAALQSQYTIHRPPPPPARKATRYSPKDSHNVMNPHRHAS
jgi:hypothetical protein